MSSSTDEEPLSVVIDGLNVMGHASNDWNIPSWLGLVNLLSIFKEISKTMNKELLIITVLREHANIERQSLSFDGGRNIIKIEWPEFLDAIRSMSKLIILNLLMKIMNPKMNWLSFQKNSKVVQKTR